MPAPLPPLRADLAFVEQVYRGEKSFVVKDRVAQRYFRFGQAEVRVMRALDGARTAPEVVEHLADSGLRVTAQAVEGFARTLAANGFLERTAAERSLLQLERLRAERGRRRRRSLFRGELLRMRWSFGDPDALLARVLPSIRWLFTPAFAAASALLFALYFIVLGERWNTYAAALQATYSLHTLTLEHIAVLWLVGLVVVLIHELGHGFTCKYFGGEVHELGFMLLYFQPAFYCNVSDAWSFPDRRARLWVTAAGSWIQLVIASLAALTWWIAAPGTLLAEASVAAMLIGGAMTLLTNANPLLPLDGYFALTDWLEIPNLRHRALAHFAWWVKRTLLRLQLPEPDATFRERRVFLTYGALSAAYIGATFLLFASFVFGWSREAFGGIGIAAAAAALALLSRRSLGALRRAIALTVRTHGAAWRRRLRPRRLLLLGAGILALAAIVPWPLSSMGRFTVHPSEIGIVAPDADGVVARVLVSEGMHVDAGAPLLELVDRTLELELLDAGRVVDSLTAGEATLRATGRAAMAEERAASRRAALARWTALEERAGRLVLRAPIAGVVVGGRPEELLGRRVRSGDSLLAIAAIDTVEVRIALSGEGATRVRPGQVARLVSRADVASPWTGAVSGVSIAGSATEMPGMMEARVRMPAAGAWRPGATGEASIEIGRSSALGALAWKLRQLVRPDLWL